MRLGLGLAILIVMAGCIQVDVAEPETAPVLQEQAPAPPPAPEAQADFDWFPPTPEAGEPVRFTPSVRSSAEGDEVQRVAWTIAGATHHENTPTTPLAEGEHHVKLEVVLASGMTASAERIVTVAPASASDDDAAEQPTPPPGNETTGAPAEAPAARDEPASNGTAVEVIPEDASSEVVQLREAVQQHLEGGPSVSVRARLVDTLFGFDSWGPPRSFSLTLQPSQLVDEEAWAAVDKQDVPFPFVEVYEGHVDGEPDSVVRLVLTWHWARGSIRVGDEVHLIRYEMAGNLPMAGGSAVAAPIDAVAKQPPALFERPDWAAHPCPDFLSEWTPIDYQPVVALGPSGLEPITTRIVMAGDGRYIEQVGHQAMPLLVAMLAEADAIYDHEVGIRFTLTGLHLDSALDQYRDPEVDDPLGDLEARFNGWRDGDRDLFHLVTGWPSSYAQANCIGAVGHPDSAYSFTPFEWEHEYVVFHTTALAHEWGHLFAAHHHYGNHGEAHLATLMIQGYTPGADPNFSSLTKGVIRGWAENNL
ncbi:MAG: M12 family metallo-peptidase [Thermoplasmatota archaeon]